MDKWILLGIIAAIFNPVPTGFLAGYFLHKEKKTRKAGFIITIASALWFIALLAVEFYYRSVFGPVV